MGMTKQAYDEQGYNIPVHWMRHPTDKKGRLFYGYWNAAVARVPKSAKTGRVADAGSGDGRVLGLLRDAGFKHLTGIDYSKRALQFVEGIIPDAQLVRADLKKIPLAGDTFDAIVCIETMEHIHPEELPLVCKELARILKPGGTLVVTVPGVGYGPAKGAHYQHFTVESLTKYLSVDLKVKKIEGQDRMGFHPLKVLYTFMEISERVSFGWTV